MSVHVCEEDGVDRHVGPRGGAVVFSQQAYRWRLSGLQLRLSGLRLEPPLRWGQPPFHLAPRQLAARRERARTPLLCIGVIREWSNRGRRFRTEFTVSSVKFCAGSISYVGVDASAEWRNIQETIGAICQSKDRDRFQTCLNIIRIRFLTNDSVSWWVLHRGITCQIKSRLQSKQVVPLCITGRQTTHLGL